MKIELNEIAFEWYTRWKPTEMRLIIHVLCNVDKNNQLVLDKKNIMNLIGINEPKTYFVAMRKLKDAKVITKINNNGLYDVNKNIITVIKK